MSDLAEKKESRSPSTISDSSLSSSENEQASDDEELQRLLEQRSSSPSIRFSEERLLNEFRTLYSESLNISSLEQSGLQETTEDEKKQKLEAVQGYVAEFLSQQHEMLIETMDQMEKDANQKISFLEGRLTTSLKKQRDTENKCGVLERTVAALKLALEEKNKEIAALQKDLNSLLSTMAKAQSSGSVNLSGISLSANNEHENPLEGLVVMSQSQLLRDQEELNTLRLKHSESLDRLAQTSSQLEELHSNYSQVESELQNTTKRMTLLEGELEEWQTGKKKSEQIAQLQSEIAAMETALEGMTENSSQYKLAMAEKESLLGKEQELQKSMQQELSNKDIRLEQLQKELEVLAAAKQQLDEQQHIQATQMKELEEQLTTVKHEVTQRQLLLQELEVELKGSHDHNAGLQQQVDEYCSSIDKLEQELAITKQKHHIAIQEAQELRRQLSGSEIDLSQQKSLLSLELSNRDLIIEQLQAEKQALDDKYQHSCLQVQQSERDMKSLKSQLELVQQQASALQLRLSSAQDEGSSAKQEVERCQQLIKELQEQLQASARSEEQMRSMAEESQCELQELKSQHRRLSEQVETRKEMLQKLQTSFSSIQQQNEDLKQEINHRQEKVNQLEEQLLTAKESSNSLESKVKSKQVEIEVIRKTNEEERVKLLDEIQALQKELADANRSVCNEVKKLEQKIIGLNESHKVDLQSSETILKDHRNTIAHLEDQNTELYSENDKMKKCLAEKEAALINAMAKAADKEHSMQNMLSDKKRSIEKFQLDIEVYEAQLNNEKSLTNQLRVKESSLKMELSEKEAEMKKLKEHLRTKEEALTKLNKDLMVKQKSLADLHTTITRHTSDLGEWQRVCQEQSDKILSMQQEVEEKGEELVRTKSTISDLHHQLLQQSDRNTTVMQEHHEESITLHNMIDSLKEQLSCRERELDSIRQELTEAHTLAKDLQLVKSDLEIKVSRSQQSRTSLEQELELANDHVSELEAQRQEAIDKTLQLEEKLRCAVLSCEELNGQYVLLQRRCSDQGAELAQARAEHQQVKMELAESQSKIDLVEHAAKQQEQQHTMMLEKIKYIQSEKDNELSYLNKELSSVQQKCSLLEMSVEDHQAENTRLKRELSEIEMAHKLEREKSNRISERLVVAENKLSVEEEAHGKVSEELSTSLSHVDSLTEQVTVLQEQNCVTEEQCSQLREEVATLRDKLSYQVEERSQMESAIAQLKDTLHQSEVSHGSTKGELTATQRELKDYKLLSSKLQKDCTDITQHVSSWSKQQRLTNETMANKIREQQQVISKLETEKHQLQLKNETLLLSNSKLQTKLQWSETLQSVERQQAMDTSPIAKLRATVDVDIISSSSSQEKPMASTPTSGYLMESQYAAALKRGLTEESDETGRIALKDSGSDSGVDSETHRTTNDASLDKTYWIHRAAELSMQLQQSSAYWSDKVRQLSSQLEETTPLHQ